MKIKTKIITLLEVSAVSTAVIHLINRGITNAAGLKNILSVSTENFYEWRNGKIFYTKKGSGSPILLIHDLIPGASGYEWTKIEDQLASTHTVYTVDLLGCGRSEKPGITYTNFLFVQLINDFIKDVIKEKTDVIASGFSGSFVAMTTLYNKDCINKIVLINPPSIKSLTKSPTEKDKIYKFLLDIPVLGTMLYNIIVSRETISSQFMEHYFHNPFNVKDEYVDAYYESAHMDGYFAKYIYTSMISKYMNINIANAVKTLNNDVLLVEGQQEKNCEAIMDEYVNLNISIQTAVIMKAKHMPQLENSDGLLCAIQDFI